jgi:hypothetical protein
MDGLEESHRKDRKYLLGYRGLVSKTVRIQFRFWSDSQNCNSMVVPWTHHSSALRLNSALNLEPTRCLNSS